MGTGGVMASGTTRFPRDTWFQVEWYTHIGSNGTMQTWIDKVLQWNITNVDTSGLLQNGGLYLMPMIYGSSGTIYVTEMALYDVNMNGGA